MADGISGIVGNGTASSPIVVKLIEELPEMAPVVIRNAEGAVQVGKTALNVAKGVGLTIGVGVLVGTGTALVVGSAMGTFWVFSKIGEAVKNKWEKRQDRLAQEEEAKKNATATPAQA